MGTLLIICLIAFLIFNNLELSRRVKDLQKRFNKTEDTVNDCDIWVQDLNVRVKRIQNLIDNMSSYDIKKTDVEIVNL